MVSRLLLAVLLAATAGVTTPPPSGPSAALGAPNAPATGPAGFVATIYRRVASGAGDQGGQFAWLEAKDRPRTFSRALVTLWAESDAKQERNGDGVGAIGWDPVTASQDPMVKSFHVKVERQDATTATVAVTLVDPRGRRRVAADETVRWELVKEDGRWKADDLRGSVDGRPWSVRESLKSYLAP